MKLTKLDDDQWYFNRYRNEEDNIHLCLSLTATGSFRVNVHPNDNMTVWCSICCGTDKAALMQVWVRMWAWLEVMDDWTVVKETCRLLAAEEAQGQRPYGKNPEFVKAFEELLSLGNENIKEDES